jgi:cyclic pyranopterin phosphate synthase
MPHSPKPLSHLDRNGRARMVDVSAKAPTPRQASVQAVIRLSPEAFEAIQRQSLKKGDPFTVAMIAGIQAAKRTAELIPLCHSLPLDHVEITCESRAATNSIRLVAHAATTAKTGVELEAFVAAAIGALALYDMVKALDPAATITGLQLLRKTGGQEPFIRLATRPHGIPCARRS